MMLADASAPACPSKAANFRAFVGPLGRQPQLPRLFEWLRQDFALKLRAYPIKSLFEFANT